MRIARVMTPIVLAASSFCPTFAQTPPATSAPAAATAPHAEKISVSGISNAGKISAELFRGAQPSLESLAGLQSLGITTIVDLRREDSEQVAKERTRAEKLGMRFVHIPVGGFATPTAEQMAEFLALFRETPAPRVFVHCQYGRDRTGVFVAAYRIAIEHWTAEQARDEMHVFGFHSSWHPAMAEYVAKLPEKLSDDPLLRQALAPAKPAVPAGAGTGPSSPVRVTP